MQRGFFILFLQVVVSVLVTGVGIWIVLLPTSFQRFLTVNFALLSEPRHAWQITPVALRVFGMFLLWYGYSLATEFGKEVSWLAWLFRVA